MEKKCWICKRTEEELEAWALNESQKHKKHVPSGAPECIIGALAEGDDLFIDLEVGEKTTVVVCPVCNWLLEEVAWNSLSFAEKIDEHIRNHYRLKAELEYVEEKEE